ncbi:MAG: ABC transporter permease, partial [Bacteroidia bacterium]|nr:ABC transporter permease [Bacteroidia bacterium]
MRLPLFIAYRYLFSKKKINAINIITAIAMLGFGVGAFAMIVILSVFNGFENIVENLINHYDPEIKITAKGRKTFEYTTDLEAKIRAIEEVDVASQSLEEKVVVKYNDKQEIARIKGVDSFFNEAKFDSLIVLGQFDLGDSTQNLGVFGGGLANKLNLFPGSQSLVTVFVPNREVEFNSLNPQAALSTDFIRASSVFMLHEEIDNEVFLTSLEFSQNLLNYPNSISSLELTIKPGSNPAVVKEELVNALGDSWEVKTRVELNELIYKIFRSEKWLTYAILSLVLVISSFNIFGSLIMLVLDKKKDIGILKSMGAEERTIRKVFLWQGSYIAILGGGIGVLLAV